MNHSRMGLVLGRAVPAGVGGFGGRRLAGGPGVLCVPSGKWGITNSAAGIKCCLNGLNSSLRSSDTTGRAFGKPNRTLVPAPMVFRHKTLHLAAELTGKENTTRNLQQQEAGPSGLFPVRIIFLKSRLICNSVITLVGGDRDWRPLELWRVSSCFF